MDDPKPVEAELLPSAPSPSADVPSATEPAPKKKKTAMNDFMAMRDELVAKYYKTHKSLCEKIEKNPDGNSVEAIIGVIINEIMREADNLLGNSLIFTQDGEIHNATSVIVKHVETLQTMSNILLRKKELMAKSGEVDLKSPAFYIFQKICFEKMVSVLEDMEFPEEVRTIAINRWGTSMGDWEKILNERLNNIK